MQAKSSSPSAPRARPKPRAPVSDFFPSRGDGTRMFSGPQKQVLRTGDRVRRDPSAQKRVVCPLCPGGARRELPEPLWLEELRFQISLPSLRESASARPAQLPTWARCSSLLHRRWRPEPVTFAYALCLDGFVSPVCTYEL